MLQTRREKQIHAPKNDEITYDPICRAKTRIISNIRTGRHARNISLENGALRWCAWHESISVPTINGTWAASRTGALTIHEDKWYCVWNITNTLSTYRTRKRPSAKLSDWNQFEVTKYYDNCLSLNYFTVPCNDRRLLIPGVTDLPCEMTKNYTRLLAHVRSDEKQLNRARISDRPR